MEHPSRPSVRSFLPRRMGFPYAAAAVAVSVLALLGGCAHPRVAEDEARAAAVTARLEDQRASLRTRLAARRDAQVVHLREYAAAGSFPHNFTAPVATHIFRDDASRLCAVANLVQQDGLGALVDTTARTRNDLAVAEVHDGPILDWALESGLTQEELVRIQFPSRPWMLPRPTVASKPKAKPAAAPPRAPEPKVAAPAEVAGMTEAEMQAFVRTHIATVVAELEAHRDASLDLAVSRYMERHDVEQRAQVASL